MKGKTRLKFRRAAAGFAVPGVLLFAGTCLLGAALPFIPYELDRWIERAQVPGTHVPLLLAVWLISLLLVAVAVTLNTIAHLGRPTVRLHPRCRECDYDLRGAAHDRCPECGTPVAKPPKSPPRFERYRRGPRRDDEAP